MSVAEPARRLQAERLGAPAISSPERELAVGEIDDRRIDLVLPRALDPAGKRRQARIEEHLGESALEEGHEELRVEEPLDDREGLVPVAAFDVRADEVLHDFGAAVVRQFAELALQKDAQQ